MSKEKNNLLSSEEERAVSYLLEAVSDYSRLVHEKSRDPFEAYAQWLQMKFFGDRQALGKTGLRGYQTLLQAIIKEKS